MFKLLSTVAAGAAVFVSITSGSQACDAELAQRLAEQYGSTGSQKVELFREFVAPSEDNNQKSSLTNVSLPKDKDLQLHGPYLYNTFSRKIDRSKANYLNRSGFYQISL